MTSSRFRHMTGLPDQRLADAPQESDGVRLRCRTVDPSDTCSRAKGDGTFYAHFDAVKTYSRMILGVAALVVVAGCGGSPLHVGGDGGRAGRGGTAGHDGGITSTCHGLDEASCDVTPGCEAQHCQVCPGMSTFAGCSQPGEPVACPAEACVTAGPCTSLDANSCKARSGCTVLSCPDCMGGQTFVGCAAPGGAGVGCGACPPDCSTLDETSCKANDHCHPGYCTDCSGGQKFTACVGPNEAVACPTTACPLIPAPCANVTTEAACDARIDCHSVFLNPTGCGCIGAGCCAVFSRCADGGKAACKGTPVCQSATPHCEAPAYVVSYTASCYEGCVRPTECAP